MICTQAQEGLVLVKLQDSSSFVSALCCIHSDSSPKNISSRKACCPQALTSLSPCVCKFSIQSLSCHGGTGSDKASLHQEKGEQYRMVGPHVRGVVVGAASIAQARTYGQVPSPTMITGDLTALTLSSFCKISFAMSHSLHTCALLQSVTGRHRRKNDHSIYLRIFDRRKRESGGRRDACIDKKT